MSQILASIRAVEESLKLVHENALNAAEYLCSLGAPDSDPLVWSLRNVSEQIVAAGSFENISVSQAPSSSAPAKPPLALDKAFENGKARSAERWCACCLRGFEKLDQPCSDQAGSRAYACQRCAHKSARSEEISEDIIADVREAGAVFDSDNTELLKYWGAYFRSWSNRKSRSKNARMVREKESPGNDRRV